MTDHCVFCDRDVPYLVVDVLGTPQEAEMCEQCRDVTEIMANDNAYLVDDCYRLLSLGESQTSFMRRMHALLLPAAVSVGQNE